MMLANEVTSQKSDENGIDFNSLFGDIDWANANLGELEQQWRTELACIEEENIKGIIESSQKGQLVLPSIQKAIHEISSVDDLLSDYCQRLRLMGHEIQQIEELNRGLALQTENQNRLLAEIDNIFSKIEIPKEILLLLEREPLDSPSMVSSLADASDMLYKVLTARFEDGLDSLLAVKEQLQMFGNIQNRFIDRLSIFFIHIFTAYKEKNLDSRKSSKKGNTCLTAQEDLVSILKKYEPLFNRLRIIDPLKFSNVLSSYQTEINSVYKKELYDLLENLKLHHISKSQEEKNYLFTNVHPSSSSSFLSNVGHHKHSSISSTKYKNLSSIEPFQIADLPDLGVHEVIPVDQALHFAILNICINMARQQSICLEIFAGIKSDDQSIDQQSTHLIETILNGIFNPSTDELLVGFVEYFLKIDISLSLELLIVLDIRIPQLKTDLPGFAKALSTLKRKLISTSENFINEQVHAIDSMKFTSRKRSGILPFVSTFPNFIKKMDLLTTNAPVESNAREILYKGLERITVAIFRNLDALIQEAEVSAEEKEQNGSYLVSELSRLKTPIVEKVLEMSKKRYGEHLKLYCSFSLHRYFTRLFELYDGITQMLETTPAQEISFHSSYNKATVRRLLQSFTIKDVKRNLETLFSRVEKHFADDREMQSLVWESLKNEFIKFTGTLTEYLAIIYPGTDVTLPYSLDDARTICNELSRF